MAVNQHIIFTERYARCIEISRRERWDIDRDVIRGRDFDFTRKFLSDGISRLGALDFLDADDKRLIIQIQGRTYANMFSAFVRACSGPAAGSTSSPVCSYPASRKSWEA